MHANEPVTIVFSSDGNYAPYLMVAIASALEHLQEGRPCRVYVMDCGIPVFWKARLNEVAASRRGAEIRYLDVTELDRRLDAMFRERGSKGRVTGWSYTTYYRLFLADMLPEARRTLYLDVDILVCDDLGKVFDAEMGGKSIACVKDVCLCDDASCVEYRRRLLGCGHDMESYFNAGILLLNLEKWRGMGDLQKRVENAFCNLPHLIFPDQDILNHVFREDKLMLHRRWNFLTPQLDGAQLPPELERETAAMVAGGDFGIVHYAGGKPWKDPLKAPLAALWWAQARRTGLDGDIIYHEHVLLRRCLQARKEAGRLHSLRWQLWIVRMRLLFAGARRRQTLQARLQRLEQKMSMARKAKSIKL